MQGGIDLSAKRKKCRVRGRLILSAPQETDLWLLLCFQVYIQFHVRNNQKGLVSESANEHGADKSTEE